MCRLLSGHIIKYAVTLHQQMASLIRQGIVKFQKICQRKSLSVILPDVAKSITIGMYFVSIGKFI